MRPAVVETIACAASGAPAGWSRPPRRPPECERAREDGVLFQPAHKAWHARGKTVLVVDPALAELVVAPVSTAS